MRYLRRKKMHVMIIFLVLYLSSVIIFSRRVIPDQDSIRSTSAYEAEYDFESNFRQFRVDETLISLPDADKVEEKIDWHDYDVINSDKLRKGNGEQGVPVIVNPDEENAVPSKFKDIGYNAAASMKLAIDRAVPDLRHPRCYTKLYYKNLPQASIIIPFHNEMNFTLLRTVHGIVKHSPQALLKEIILVDDASTDGELMGPLEQYLNTTFPDVHITIHRIPVKQGLMNARSSGASQAQGDVLVFLDAHVEVGINYLPPLIEPIADDYKTITNPIVGAIDNKNFRIFSGMWYGGGVDTKMNFTYFNANPKYVAKPTNPYPNPIMIGCAFAISKRWWTELEGYDPMLRMWGSEQFELSFKTWMCGGSQVNVPCSRIAHLFRPRRESTSKEDAISRENNFHRVALVWMDEYVDYVYLTYERLLKINPGDVSRQMRLRRKLQCKTFDWFMKNIQPEMLRLERLPKLPYIAWGRISSRHDTSKCIRIRETMGFTEFILTDCQWGDDGLMPEHFHFTINNILSTTVRKPSVCLVPAAVPHNIGISDCVKSDLRQRWAYNSVNGHFTHMQSKVCMEMDLFNVTVRLRPCDENNISQSWDFQFVDPSVKFL